MTRSTGQEMIATEKTSFLFAQSSQEEEGTHAMQGTTKKHEGQSGGRNVTGKNKILLLLDLFL